VTRHRGESHHHQDELVAGAADEAEHRLFRIV
jgi:hypothetical protein